MKIPEVKMTAGFSGYVRGDYIIDNEKLNRLVKEEVLKAYPLIESVDENSTEDVKTVEEIRNFIKATAESFYFTVRGEMDIVRDDTTTTHLDVELKED